MNIFISIWYPTPPKILYCYNNKEEMTIMSLIYYLFLVICRTAFVLMGTKLWYKIQHLVKLDETPANNVIDRVHDSEWCRALNKYFTENAIIWRSCTIFTTLLFDIFLLINAYDVIIYGNMLPYYMTFSAMILRHMCVSINRLPPPQRLHWKDPGVPTVFMTYDTIHDFFFSGYTTFSLITGLNVFYWNTFTMIMVPIFIVSEILFVIVSNGHYMMDVYAGIMTYFGLRYIFLLLGY